MGNINPLRYLNPLDDGFKAGKIFARLSRPSRAKIIFLTILGSLLTLGIGSIAAFRLSTKMISRLDIRQQAASPLGTTSKKIDSVQQSILSGNTAELSSEPISTQEPPTGEEPIGKPEFKTVVISDAVQIIGPEERNKRGLNKRDTVAYVEFEDKDISVVISGEPFLPSTIARYIAIDGTPTFTETLRLWNSLPEYRSLLEQLIPLVTEEQALPLQAQLDALKSYEEAKAEIARFDQGNEISFHQLLCCLKNKMAAHTGAGASLATKAQQQGFDGYITIRDRLPEPIKKVLFPLYSWNPGDPQCISSAARVFQKQIDRLVSLGLVEAISKGDKPEAKRDISQEIGWFIKNHEYSQRMAPPILFLGRPTETISTHYYGVGADGSFRAPTDITISRERYSTPNEAFSAVYAQISAGADAQLADQEFDALVQQKSNEIHDILSSEKTTQKLIDFYTHNRPEFRRAWKSELGFESEVRGFVGPGATENIKNAIAGLTEENRALLSQDFSFISWVLGSTLGKEIPVYTKTMEQVQSVRGAGFPGLLAMEDRTFAVILNST